MSGFVFFFQKKQFCLNIVLALTNSVNPDEMSHYACKSTRLGRSRIQMVEIQLVRLYVLLMEKINCVNL